MATVKSISAPVTHSSAAEVTNDGVRRTNSTRLSPVVGQKYLTTWRWPPGTVVAVGVLVAASGVLVLVAVFVAVLVAVFVGVLVAVLVGVFVAVFVGVFVAVFVAVLVAVFVGVAVGATKFSTTILVVESAATVKVFFAPVLTSTRV